MGEAVESDMIGSMGTISDLCISAVADALAD